MYKYFLDGDPLLGDDAQTLLNQTVFPATAAEISTLVSQAKPSTARPLVVLRTDSSPPRIEIYTGPGSLTSKGAAQLIQTETKILYGTADIPVVNSNEPYNIWVAFGGRLPITPHIVVSAYTQDINLDPRYAQCYIKGSSTSGREGFNIRAMWTGPTPTPFQVSWIATYTHNYLDPPA
ncbi:MAG: hypothetical protein LBJ62_05805 [Bifidobacteriaceae bacterium]|jgi:hypothetical protein|nr:hypothetical protein [Bifidobacteriaceae bacterium]